DVGVSRVFRQTIPGQSGPLFYARDLFVHDRVLAPIVLFGVLVAIWAARRGRVPAASAAAVGISAALPALLFSVSRSRLSHYMLPAYPPLAALAGTGLATWLTRPSAKAILAAAVAVLSPVLRVADVAFADYAPTIKALGLESQSYLGLDDSLYTFNV